jgi:tetratricopeptide (TPR) repeat protein
MPPNLYEFSLVKRHFGEPVFWCLGTGIPSLKLTGKLGERLVHGRRPCLHETSDASTTMAARTVRAVTKNLAGLSGRAQVGESARAHRLGVAAEAFAHTTLYAKSLTGLAAAIARVGDFDHAAAAARTITDPDAQAQALTELANVAAQAGDPDRAEALADDAEALARTITDPDYQVLAEFVEAVAYAGDPARAEALARTITDPHAQAQAQAFSGLADVAARAGDRDRAYQLADDAEALARTRLAHRIPELDGLSRDLGRLLDRLQGPHGEVEVRRPRRGDGCQHVHVVRLSDAHAAYAVGEPGPLGELYRRGPLREHVQDPHLVSF